MEEGNEIVTGTTPEPECSTPQVPQENNEKKASNGNTLKSILGGDFLTSDFLRRQTPLLVLVVIFAIIYISNRYSSQQELIQIDNLKKELLDIKYDALTLSSELTEKTRQSRIEEYVSSEDSKIETATNAPYKIIK